MAGILDTKSFFPLSPLEKIILPNALVLHPSLPKYIRGKEVSLYGTK